MRCANCGRNCVQATLIDVDEGWLCHQCRQPMGWTKKEKIKSRVRMPDGTILQGKQGQRVVSERLKAQEKTEKYRVKTA